MSQTNLFQVYNDVRVRLVDFEYVQSLANGRLLFLQQIHLLPHVGNEFERLLHASLGCERTLVFKLFSYVTDSLLKLLSRV